jgi:hypothetical protein
LNSFTALWRGVDFQPPACRAIPYQEKVLMSFCIRSTVALRASLALTASLLLTAPLAPAQDTAASTISTVL